MKYREARDYRTIIEQRGMVPGLDNMKRLLEVLGNPQDGMRFIHVAGTNGKGSVVAYLSKILTLSGYRTGAYTSPAVFHPLEIYQVDGKRMEEAQYARLMGTICDALTKLEEDEVYPTPFEVDTAMAFLHFLDEKCDIVVIEAGLGGALDATNCIENTECAVFTRISMDHVHVLGSTLEEIAAQKAGIIKDGCMVVSGMQEMVVRNVFEQMCIKKDSSLTIVDECYFVPEYDVMGNVSGSMAFRYKHFPEMIPGIRGRCQKENVAIVLEVVEKLCQKGYNIPVSCIKKGIEETQWHGRMTLAKVSPPVILDGAHNAQAVEALSQELVHNWEGYHWVFVMGVLADKEYEHMFDNIVSSASKILTVTPANRRALNKKELARVLHACGADVCEAENVTHAVTRALKWCGESPDRGIVVFGSFTILREAEMAVNNYMPLVEKLISNPLFNRKIQQIEAFEKERSFCCHGWEHCMAVARAAALMNEEQKLGFSKQTLYALALVHDLGRAEQYAGGIPHEEAGVETAHRLLVESGFEKKEIEQMLGAILHHRQEEPDMDELTHLLVRADKQTRLCFACEAKEACKWPDEKKNLSIRI